MDIETTIKAIAGNKKGNKEVAIFFDPETTFESAWEIHLGNPTPAVMLGEVEGEFVGIGKTLEEAIEDLKLEIPLE